MGTPELRKPDEAGTAPRHDGGPDGSQDETLTLPRQAADRLTALLLAHRFAERELAAYLEGLLRGSGVEPASYRSFDDEAGTITYARPVS